MPYVENNGVKIHYEVSGAGAPLVIQHGFTLDVEVVKALGYPKYFEKGRRIILIDARGHGLSDKPRGPDNYGMRKSAGDILAVLDDLGISKAGYFGYSMGGVIGFALAKYAPGRLRFLVIGGAHPYADELKSFRMIDGKDQEAFLNAMEGLVEEKIDPGLIPELFKNDLEALTAAARPRPSMEDVLPNIKIPCLLYAGTADSRHELVESCARRIPGAGFVSFPELNHVECYSRADLVAPHILKFLDGTDALTGGD